MLLHAIFVAFYILLSSANANSMVLLRDAEIEDLLTDMARDIFKVAQLDPQSAKIYVIASNDINAFTIGGGYMFLTSGIILKYPNPLHLLAIMCHETGHMAARHINRQIAAIQSASNNLGIASIAALIGSAVTGSTDAAALLLGYAMTTTRFFLRFSRSEEMAADILAATYLQKLGYDPKLLIESFYEFQRMDIMNGSINLPEYIRSHPKTDDRINALMKFVTNRNKPIDKNLLDRYRRITEKLKAYIAPYYDNAYKDEYGKAIYLHRIGKTADAIKILQNLVNKNNDDIYYASTLAQMLNEVQQTQTALNIYQKIYSSKINPLLKIEYASILLESKKNISTAIQILTPLQYEGRVDSDVFRLLGKAYGLCNQKGMSDYFIGREQIINGHYSAALLLFKRSLKTLPKGSREYEKAKYFINLINREYRD